MTKPPHVPFSQRTGLEPIPPQLQLGEVSEELRRLLHYAIIKDMEEDTQLGYRTTFFGDRWKPLARDLWVRHLWQNPEEFQNTPPQFEGTIKTSMNRSPLGSLFDLVEFFLRHPNCQGTTKTEIAQASRKHLVNAGTALRKGDWPGSVRESIHAVETVAVKLAPSENTLGAALREIEKQGHLHGRLKAAFTALYGYASDEKGVRHAHVFDDDEAKVDEADALFMLGACASFVSYLLARTT